MFVMRNTATEGPDVLAATPFEVILRGRQYFERRRRADR
jgi:hypothetical protein